MTCIKKKCPLTKDLKRFLNSWNKTYSCRNTYRKFFKIALHLICLLINFSSVFFFVLFCLSKDMINKYPFKIFKSVTTTPGKSMIRQKRIELKRKTQLCSQGLGHGIFPTF